MIVDHIRNQHIYAGLSDKFKKAFDFIEKFNDKKLPVGRYEIDGDDVYALVFSYETKPACEGKWEAHRKFIDLQYIAEGEEIFGWRNIDSLTPEMVYDAEGDVILYKNEAGTQVKLSKGYFMLLYPEDAHMPGCIMESVQPVLKIVVKIKI